MGIWLFGFLIGMGRGLTFSHFLVLFLLISFIMVLLIYMWAKLSYKYYRYEVAKDGFKKESGVIYKKYVTIPYEKIQNVDIYRGVLARILGLSDLHIQTAGYSAQITRFGMIGSQAEGRLPGLLQEDAEKLRDELIKREKSSLSQDL